MVHGFYEHVDEWGKQYHLSAKIGGFKDESAAVKAIAKRGGVGYTTDHRNVVLNIVRNGQIVRLI